MGHFSSFDESLMSSLKQCTLSSAPTEPRVECWFWLSETHFQSLGFEPENTYFPCSQKGWEPLHEKIAIGRAMGWEKSLFVRLCQRANAVRKWCSRISLAPVQRMGGAREQKNGLHQPLLKTAYPPRENITKIIRPEYIYVILGGDYGKIM